MTIVYFGYESMVESNRKIAFNKIDMYYDEMELYVAKNRMTPDNELLSYLKSFKQIKVNNELADIQVLIIMASIAAKNKELQEKIAKQRDYIQTLPIELRQIGDKINGEVTNAIQLSMCKVDFLFIVGVILSRGLFKAIFSINFDWVNNLYLTSKEIMYSRNFVSAVNLTPRFA